MKMNWSEASFNFKARVIFTGVVAALLYGAIVARAVDVMVIDGPKYREMASKERLRVKKLAPPRGDIVDANGRVLANSVMVDSVYAHPYKVHDPAGTAGILAPILNEREDALLEKLAGKGKFVWLKRALSPSQAAAVRRNDLQGVALINEFARYYPEGRLAAHVLGFTGVDGNGLEGIEHKYDAQLTGDESCFMVERDAMGRYLYNNPDKMPVATSGHRLNLTLDIRIQQVVENALDKALEENQATVGMAAVMEVSTGRVLAMAVRPTFNPNNFGKYPASSYRNRIITDIFEPGSTFKTFTLAALLDAGLGKLDDELYCEDGAFELDGSIINDTSPHSWFTIEEIIVHSSNIGAAKMGLKLGRQKLRKYVKRFGFGQPTGVDLGGENPGMVRSFDKISRVGIANIAFGQGIGVTGLQLLAAFNAIANGGRWVQPYVVESMTDYTGRRVYQAHPSTRRVVSAQTAGDEKRALVNVIHGGGTGGRAAPDGYKAAGKTGTAQKVDFKSGGYFEDRYIASFMGFVPAEAPAISVLVVVDDPQGDPWGGKVAGPAFKTIVERSLPLLGILPEDADRPLEEIAAAVYSNQNREQPPPSHHSMGDAGESTGADGNDVNVLSDGAERAGAADCARCMPDLMGMTLREILKTAGERGAKVEVVGSGRAVRQEPPPGSTVSGQKRWRVQLALDPY